MKTFRDAKGREWSIVVDVNAIKRVLKSSIEYLGEPLKVNLLELVDENGDLLEKVAAFPPLICDIAYALCKPQCDAKNVSDEDFGEAMRGDVLNVVIDTILEETIDFFHDGRRAIFKKILSKTRTFSEKANLLLTAKIEGGEVDAAVDAMLDPMLEQLRAPLKTGTGSAGNSLESSASTPAREPSPS